MSVTVMDLLKLPSLRSTRVVAGEGGLSRSVASISVLESTDPKLLTDKIFQNDAFYGSEIVITGFTNIQNDVDCQCANMRRLAEAGEVGLILFYVGALVPSFDPRLMEIANEMDGAPRMELFGGPRGFPGYPAPSGGRPQNIPHAAGVPPA